MHIEDYDHIYENLVPEWNYEEFSHLTRIESPRTAFARGYYFNDGHFYIESWFYTQLTRLFERFPKEKERILASLWILAANGKNVLFTRDIHDPIFKDDAYLYIEIAEVVEAAELKFDDISRGSDYGD